MSLAETRVKLKWLAGYHGRAGYQLMYDELTGSFFRDFPELVGRVGVFNFAAPPEAELARLRHDLDLPDDQLRKITSQEQTSHKSRDTHKTPQERSRAVAWGVNPAIYGPDMDQLTPQQINNLAWQMTHEIFHAADDILNRQRPTTLKYENPDTRARWVESLADAGRVSLFARNYGSYPDYLNVLKNFTATLDAERPFAPVSQSGMPRSDQPLAQFIFASTPERYDNGQMIAHILKTTPHERQSISYELYGWRKSFDQVTWARDEWPAARLENMQLETATSIILADTAGHFKMAALKKLEPIAQQFQDTYGQSAHDMVEGLFGTSELYALARTTRGPLADELSEVILGAQQNFLNWVRDREHFIPSAGRLLAAHDFLSRRTEEIGSYVTPAMTDVQGMIRAAASFLHTRDPLDESAAEIYSLTQGGMPIDQKRRMLQLFYEDPELQADLEQMPSPRDTR